MPADGAVDGLGVRHLEDPWTSLQVQPSEVSEGHTMHRPGKCVYKGA